jgi:hypothetical protein
MRVRVILNAKAFLLEPPPALSSRAYAKAYYEVIAVGGVDSTEWPQDRSLDSPQLGFPVTNCWFWPDGMAAH